MKKAITVIIIAITAYAAVFAADFIMILNEKPPVFCIKKESASYITYYGLGYSYEICPHIITGKKEYVLCILGQEISSNLTNSTNLIEPPVTVTETNLVSESILISDTPSETTAVSESLSEIAASTAVQTAYETDIERSNIVIVNSYRNWAWGYQHSGTFIDLEGKVYEFDFSDEEIKNNDDFVARLEDYYHSVDLSYSQKVSDPDLIFEIAALSDLISPNAEIIKEHTAHDAGQDTIYVLNSDNDLIKLYSHGDYSETNTDEYAVKAADLCKKL